ncbi:twin-arginine translocase subunit TatC [Parvibaculum sp. MBR-TMA-1.3b-4.2]|jgi:sec-independent protein translocase protein TatC
MSEYDGEIGASRAWFLRPWGLTFFVAIAFVVSFFFAPDISAFLLAPYSDAIGAENGVKLGFTSPREFFLMQVAIAFFGATCLAIPILAAQFRVTGRGFRKNPGLSRLAVAVVLFAFGSATVYFVLLPQMIEIAPGVHPVGNKMFDDIADTDRAKRYLTLAMKLILFGGFVFQLPLVLTRSGQGDENARSVGGDA